MAKDKLTAQQVAFVDAYMVHFNATRAAREAGFKSPAKYGHQLLQKPYIKEEVGKRAKDIYDGKEALRHRIVEELCAIAFSNLGDVGTFGPHGIDLKQHKDIPEDTKRAIAEYTVTERNDSINAKVRFHNKIQALEALGRYIELFKESQVSVNVKPYIIQRRNGDQVELGVKSE